MDNDQLADAIAEKVSAKVLNKLGDSLITIGAIAAGVGACFAAYDYYKNHHPPI